MSADKPSENVELVLLPPAWGLPSPDPLAVEAWVCFLFYQFANLASKRTIFSLPQLYLSMASIPFKVEFSAYPYSPVTGALPLVRDGAVVVKALDIVDFLKKKHKNVDEQLSAVELSESYAYVTMIREKLYPAIV